jgi:cysteine synthase A
MASVIDRMIEVPDAASVAACLWLERLIGRRCGPSTGTNLIGALQLATELTANGESGSIATLICDGGERYVDTIYDAAWRTSRGLDLAPWMARFDAFASGATWRPPPLKQAAPGEPVAGDHASERFRSYVI